MQFNYTWEKVLRGLKTESCRWANLRLAGVNNNGPYEMAVEDRKGNIIGVDIYRGAASPIFRFKWMVGNTYAVQPGRGKPGLWYHPQTLDFILPQKNQSLAIISDSGYKPARIKLLRIAQVDVRCISEGSVKAEGFNCKGDFLVTWCQMHDPRMFMIWDGGNYDTWLKVVNGRIQRRYQAWQLGFCLV